jgi:hypothetical protein
MVKTGQDQRRHARKKLTNEIRTLDASASHEVSPGNGHDEIDIFLVQVHARYRCGPRSHLLSVRYLPGEVSFAAVGYVVLISQSCGHSRRVLR